MRRMTRALLHSFAAPGAGLCRRWTELSGEDDGPFATAVLFSFRVPQHARYVNLQTMSVHIRWAP